MQQIMSWANNTLCMYVTADHVRFKSVFKHLGCRFKPERSFAMAGVENNTPVAGIKNFFFDRTGNIDWIVGERTETMGQDIACTTVTRI